MNIDSLRQIVSQHTHIPLNVILIILGAIVGLSLVYAFICWRMSSKRFLREGDLRHDIDMILCPHGCRNALEHWRSAKSIHNFYGIPLAQCGYYRTIDDLKQQAINSEEIYRYRMAHVVCNDPVHMIAS